MDLDEQSEKIILRSIMTTFESSSIYGGSWGSFENRKPNHRRGILLAQIRETLCTIIEWKIISGQKDILQAKFQHHIYASRFNLEVLTLVSIYTYELREVHSKRNTIRKTCH